MFGKKNVEPESGFTATLRLPRYYPKEELLGKVVFDHELDRVGQVVDWTYTPSGVISLVVSGRVLRGMLKEGDSLSVSFECIDRVGNFILLSKPLEALIPKGVAINKEDLMGKVPIEKAFEEKFGKTEVKSEKKKGEKELKSINELEKDVIESLIPEAVDEMKKPIPKAEVKDPATIAEAKKPNPKAKVKKIVAKGKMKRPVTRAERKKPVTKAKVKKPTAKAKVKKAAIKARR
jgi:sporulation protein YlmC with PRC-barrel domain